MPQRPILVFPQPSRARKANKAHGPPSFNLPSGATQVRRLGSKIRRLARDFEARRAELRAELAGVEPEQVLVLEIAGSVADFFRTVQKTQGLEWLGEWEAEVAPDEAFFRESGQERRALPGRLYLVASNQEGISQILHLWRIFQRDPAEPEFARGYGRWARVFQHLSAIRRWGPEDRLSETGLAEDWRIRSAAGQDFAPVEVELWFRTDPTKQAQVEDIVSSRIANVGGETVGRSLISEIAYHALIARMPIGSVERLLEDRTVALARAEEVMFFRPVGQAAVRIPRGEREPVNLLQPPADLPGVDGEPILAFLDGLPLENHAWLAGRLRVDDPDNWAADYQATERIHGTAMASLIAHGDLDARQRPLTRPIYVRPILKPDRRGFQQAGTEAVPEDLLPVDLVHRAVRRLFESSPTERPAAPGVKIINLSVCDRWRPFFFQPSPWARLLDYLSVRYGVLFIVSAGNYAHDIELEIPRETLAQVAANPLELERQVYRAVANDTRNRTLLSPAESLNALTVASVHSDYSTFTPIATRYDPIQTQPMPSLFNAHGLGLRRSVKPEFLVPGGRALYLEKLGTAHARATLQMLDALSAPGQRIATPGLTAGQLTATCYTRGTSDSAALASRAAAQLYGMLMDLRNEAGGAVLDDAHFHVLMKMLLVHGASWGEMHSALANYLGDDSRDKITRLLGYGIIAYSRIFECTTERVTVIGCGSLGSGEADEYGLPLPPSLSGVQTWRRLTVTLAWCSRTNPRHRAYRVADLWFVARGRNEDGNAIQMLRITRREADWQTVLRGTVQHEILEGDQVSAFGEGEPIKILVNCRDDAGKVQDVVPYALGVTLEVASGVGIQVYDEVRVRIRPPIVVGLP